MKISQASQRKSQNGSLKKKINVISRSLFGNLSQRWQTHGDAAKKVQKNVRNYSAMRLLKRSKLIARNLKTLPAIQLQISTCHSSINPRCSKNLKFSPQILGSLQEISGECSQNDHMLSKAEIRARFSVFIDQQQAVMQSSLVVSPEFFLEILKSNNVSFEGIDYNIWPGVPVVITRKL